MQRSADVDTWFSELDHPLRPGLCSFVQVKDKKRVTLMSNAAGRLKGELTAIVRAWIDYKGQ